MATATQPARGTELDTKKQNRSSCHCQHGAREKSVGLNDETALVFAAKHGDREAFETLIARYRRRILFAAISKLTPGVREAVELRELGELSTKEAARVLGLSVSAVKARVFHGRRKLCRILKSESVYMPAQQIMSASCKLNGPLRSQLACHFGE